MLVCGTITVTMARRSLSNAIGKTGIVASAMRTISALSNSGGVAAGAAGAAADRMPLHRGDRRCFGLLQGGSTTAAAVAASRQAKKTARYRSSNPPSLTPEEAGRRAAQLASEAVQQRNRLERLLSAVDHVLVEDENDGNDHGNGSDNDRPGMATLLSHAGIDASKHRDNIPMSPPLHTATTYTRPADGIYKEGDSIYARMDNPTRLLLEQCVFELECSHLGIRKSAIGGNDTPKITSFAFSSGMQAATAILLAHSTTTTSSASPTPTRTGMTVLIPTDVYHGVRTVLSDVFSRHGVEVRELNMATTSSSSSSSTEPGGAAAIEAAISEIASAAATARAGENSKAPSGEDHRHSVIVWMETPSNPRCEVVDIQAVCDAVRSGSERWKDFVNVTTVVDGTMASPVLTRPLELGADVSFHSGTKYLAGHSDALIGTLTLSPITSRGRTLVPLLRSVQIASGGVASPWDSWLTLRGMRTLHVRVEKQCQTALKLAEYLHERQLRAGGASGMVRAVHYPGLPSHPQHDVARRQMALATAAAAAATTKSTSGANPGFGGVLSFELAGEVEAMAFAGAVQIAQRATSLGGTETLIEHRASIEPPDNVVSPPGLLRVSVGLEDPDDLIRDFESAFAIVDRVMGSDEGYGYNP